MDSLQQRRSARLNALIKMYKAFLPAEIRKIHCYIFFLIETIIVFLAYPDMVKSTE
jgi:hypothetical protein